MNPDDDDFDNDFGEPEDFHSEFDLPPDNDLPPFIENAPWLNHGEQDVEHIDQLFAEIEFTKATGDIWSIKRVKPFNQHDQEEQLKLYGYKEQWEFARLRLNLAKRRNGY